MRTVIIVLFISLTFFGCKSEHISEEERKEIIAELDSIVALDQEYAGLPPKELIDIHGFKKGWEIFEVKKDSIGLINQSKIKQLYKTYGYLGYNEVGEQASSNFWISIQHADNDVEFQQDILKALKIEIDNNNADKAEYAMLEDRVNVNLNKPQRFGSQVTYNEFAQAVPKNGLLDSINVEKLRLEYNLPSFKKYYNNMSKSHYRMNKELYIKKGLKGPKLY